MDTFMDKLAQKLTAQEMIKANAAADAEELNRLQGQVKEYQECLAEIKAVSARMNRLMEEKIAPQMNRLVEEQVAPRMDRLMKEQVAPRMDHLIEEQVAPRMDRLIKEQVAPKMDRLIEEQMPPKIDRLLQGQVAPGMDRIMEEQLKPKVDSLMKEALDRLEEARADNSQLERLVEESTARIQELQLSQEALEKLQESMKELFGQTDEYVHKENVKVYRNVQAVITEEAGKQKENMEGVVRKLGSRMNLILGISIAALTAAAGGIVFQILTYFRII